MICRCGHEREKHYHDRSCVSMAGPEGKFKFCKCEQFREVQGEDDMTKRKKSGKKRAITVRGEKLYEAFSSKIEASKYAKKVADKDAKFHTPLVARVLMSFDRPVSLERVITAAKNHGYESDNVERCVRGDLAILVREGLAKATKELNAESLKRKANGSAAKPKRKRAAKKVSKKIDADAAAYEERELEATA